MKSRYLRIAIMTLILLHSHLLWANATLEYSISKEMIDSARTVANRNGQYSLTIRLKEPYKDEFARLTRQNIGKRLRITFKGKILTEAIIRDEIESGFLQVGEWPSAEEAMKFMDTLTGKHN